MQRRSQFFALAFTAFAALALGGCGMTETASTYEDARSAFDDRQYRIANAHMADLIQQGSTDDRVRLLQVELMLAMGDGNRAIAAIEQLPQSAFGGAERRIALAHAQILQGNPAKTAQMYEPLPTEAYTEQDFRMLLWALREMGETDSFTVGMDVALDLFPQSAHLNALAADRLFDLDLPEEGETYAATALANAPDLYEVQLVAGRAAIARGELEGALGHYRRASEINPSRATPLANIAGLHLDMGNVDAAGEVLDGAIAQHPGFPMLQWKLARYRLARGDVAGAREAHERARRTFIENPQFILLTAEIEAAAGNTTLALDSYRRFVREVGEVPEVMERIAELEG